jgi:hypothetical protein
MRIFLDANLFFSAAKSDGAVRRLLALVRQAINDALDPVFETGFAEIDQQTQLQKSRTPGRGWTAVTSTINVSMA